MPDVATKCIAANDIHQNGAITVDRTGHKQVLRRDREYAVYASGIENKLDHKFDDKTYYTT